MKNTEATSNKNPSSKWFLLGLISTILAILTHGYLVFRHFEVIHGDASSESICNMSETFNCDVVAASDFSSLLGIPLALWGLITNLILLLLVLSYRFTWKEGDHFLGRISVYLADFVFTMSLVMGAIALTQLSVYCPFCIATYFLSLLTLLGFYFSVPGPLLNQWLPDVLLLFKKNRGTLTMLLAIPALAWMLNGILLGHYTKDPDRKAQFIRFQVNEWKNASPQDFSMLKGIAMGASAEEAKMTIHEFADFRCGHCKTAAPKLHAFTKSHRDVRLVFFTFPLDSACNPRMQRSAGGISCQLAKAAHCGGDSAWTIHDRIFARQREFSTPKATNSLIKEIAENVGLDWQKFNDCINSEEAHQKITKQAEIGGNSGIQGTPAIFVNGKMLSGGQDLDMLKAVYSTLK